MMQPFSAPHMALLDAREHPLPGTARRQLDRWIAIAQPTLERWTARSVRSLDAQARQDAGQEALLHLIQQLRAGARPEAGRARAWCHRLWRNALISHVRKAQAQRRRPSEGFTSLHTEEGQEVRTPVTAQERAGFADTVIEQMDRRRRLAQLGGWRGWPLKPNLLVTMALDSSPDEVARSDLQRAVADSRDVTRRGVVRREGWTRQTDETETLLTPWRAEEEDLPDRRRATWLAFILRAAPGTTWPHTPWPQEKKARDWLFQQRTRARRALLKAAERPSA